MLAIIIIIIILMEEICLFVCLFQLEYQPCNDVPQCWDLMSEFLVSFMDESFTIPSLPKCSNKNTELFCPSDTILQYIEVFNTYRKSMA